MAAIELHNGRMKMLVDPLSGTILSIEDSETGLVHIDAARDGRKDGRMFRFIVPSEMWWSCYADSQEQKNVRCVEKGKGLTIEYPDLNAADGTQTGVSVRVDISPGKVSDGFLLSMQVDNRGKRTVLDITFPFLGGWHERGENSRIAVGANHFVAPRSLSFSAGNNYARNGRRGGWEYPVGLACPWVDFSYPEGGLSYINHMTQGRNGRFWIENLAGYGDDFRLAFGWSHLLALQPGGSWSSPTMSLAVHSGDWRITAERYREWFDRLHPPDYSRPLIRSRMGFQNIFLRGFDGTPIRPFEDIPYVAESGRRYGIDMLCIWDTLTLGNYARYNPYDLTDYAPSDREKLQKGLHRAESEGTHTSALINFRHPNVPLHLPDPDIVNRVQHRYSGTFRTENWAGNHTHGDLWSRHIGPESYVFSPFSSAHRERVIRLTEDYLSLGYTSMFYDQPFENSPDYGFIERGYPPDATHHQALEIIREVRKMLLSRDPQAVVIGEENDIHATPYIDQWMSWSIAAVSEQVIERVAMLRYSMPHTILSWVVDHEPERAAIAFAMGMQLCLMVHGAEKDIGEEPLFAGRVKAMAELRRKTSARTVMARFKGRDGLEIDGDSGFAAYAYESPAGIAVTVAAYGSSASGKVTVVPEVFASNSRKDGGTIFSMEGAEVSHKGMTCEFSLDKNDVAVWML